MDTQSVSVTVQKGAIGAAVLRQIAAVIDDAETKTAVAALHSNGASAEEPEAPKKRGRGRPPKDAVKAAEVENELTEEPEAEDELDQSDDLGFADEETEEDEVEEEPAPKKKAGAVAKPAKAVKGPTLEGDIIPAFQAYAKEHSREKAAKILQRFKVNSVRALPVESYASVLKLLKA